MSNIDWAGLASERMVWAKRNFPDSQEGLGRVHAALGVIEEVGELSHHNLKRQQKIRGTEEEHLAEERDAIGDIIVYLLGPIAHLLEVGGWMTISRWESTLADLATQDEVIGQLARSAGRLHIHYTRFVEHGAEVHSLDARLMRRDAISIIILCERYCDLAGWNFDQIVTETWGKVSQRDWVTDPVAGGE